jgi:hypothetical protein
VDHVASAAVIVISGPIGRAPCETHGLTSTPRSTAPTAPPGHRIPSLEQRRRHRAATRYAVDYGHAGPPFRELCQEGLPRKAVVRSPPSPAGVRPRGPLPPCAISGVFERSRCRFSTKEAFFSLPTRSAAHANIQSISGPAGGTQRRGLLGTSDRLMTTHFCQICRSFDGASRTRTGDLLGAIRAVASIK